LIALLLADTALAKRNMTDAQKQFVTAQDEAERRGVHGPAAGDDRQSS
jgi:hypothetical protein